MCCTFYVFHDWGAVDGTNNLAPTHQGHILSAQCYQYHIHTAVLQNLVSVYTVQFTLHSLHWLSVYCHCKHCIHWAKPPRNLRVYTVTAHWVHYKLWLHTVCTTLCVHYALCALHTVCTTLCVHYTLCTLHSVCTTLCVHYTLCTLHSVYTTHCVHYTLCALHTVCTTHCVHYTLCTLHTVCTTYCVHYTLCALHTVCTTHCDSTLCIIHIGKGLCS